MENLKIIYIDDYPETSLSKYLDKRTPLGVESLTHSDFMKNLQGFL